VEEKSKSGVILGVDLCFSEGSVCVAKDGIPVSLASWNAYREHSVKIFVEIERCLENAGLKVEDVDKVVVSSGPGSFTGVRLSVTVGKVFKVCGKSEVYSVSTLSALRFGYEKLGKEVVPVIPARKERFYAFDGEDLTEDELVKRLKGLNDPIVVFKGQEVPDFLKEFPVILELTPLAKKLVLMEKHFKELTFDYVRPPDAKPMV
jgi:tRNA threonylcarbamoyladenosine biosynthesis protein TsaB